MDAAFAPKNLPPRLPAVTAATAVRGTVFGVLFAISFAHLLNDTIQALIPALYPLLKQNFGFSFTQIGIITFTFQCTASLLQPVVGFATDKRPMPWSLATGMGFTLIGLLLLSQAHNFPMIVLSAALVGMGSAVFPSGSLACGAYGRGREARARAIAFPGGRQCRQLARAAAGGAHHPAARAGTCRLVFGRGVPGHCCALAGGRVAVAESQPHRAATGRDGPGSRSRPAAPHGHRFPPRADRCCTFSKYVYLVSLTSYYMFYLKAQFHVHDRSAQFYLFAFLFAVAAGTIIGGPVGDRIGRKRVIWVSILGVAPFSIWLPHAGLALTGVLTVIIGLILASAFSAILLFMRRSDAGQSGPGRRPVLLARFWHRGHRGRRPRPHRRSGWYYRGFPRLRVAAADWIADGVVCRI